MNRRLRETALEVPIFDSDELSRIVDSIRDSGINFVAIDFDKTFVSIHTFGNWPGTAADLAMKARPFFKEFIPLSMKHGLCIAIVTFSSQVKLIQQVIHTLFPELSAFIPVRGRDLSWAYKGEGSKEAKQMHMASAAEELNWTTLLIDDDMNNIFIALKNRVRAVYCDPEQNRNMIDDLLSIE
eukprot:GSChrysophyteH1.ASY1.ANO1.2448.1 assembled CDS